MGNLSDELKEQARELARKQLQKAKKVRERAYNAAQRGGGRQEASSYSEVVREEFESD